MCHGGDTFIDWKRLGPWETDFYFGDEHTSWTSNLFTSVASVQTDQVADTDESLLHCRQATSTIHDPSSFGRDYFGGLLGGICWTEDICHSALYQTKSIKSSLDFSPSHPWCIQIGHKRKTLNGWGIQCMAPEMSCLDLDRNKLSKKFDLPCIPYWKLGETPSLLLCYGNQGWQACRSDWYNAFSWLCSLCLFHSCALRRGWWNWTWRQQGYSWPMHLLRMTCIWVLGLRQIADASCLVWGKCRSSFPCIALKKVRNRLTRRVKNKEHLNSDVITPRFKPLLSYLLLAQR